MGISKWNFIDCCWFLWLDCKDKIICTKHGSFMENSHSIIWWLTKKLLFREVWWWSWFWRIYSLKNELFEARKCQFERNSFSLWIKKYGHSKLWKSSWLSKKLHENWQIIWALNDYSRYWKWISFKINLLKHCWRS